jgi:ring-1,2-phenylacetyl-CoA epoxidase subunit PaaE
VIHVLEGEAQEIDLFTGRIDGEKVKALFAHWIDASSVDTAFICGPEPMMLAIAAALRQHGLADSADQVRTVRFGPTRPRQGQGGLEDRSRAGNRRRGDGDARWRDPLSRWRARAKACLEAALAANLDAPYSCKAGVCSTCRCKVLEGEVEMAVNHALEDYEVRAGYALSCQAYPLSDRLVVTYDE